MLRAAGRRAVGVLAISQAVARDVRAVLPRCPVRLLYNAIDVERFAPGPGDGAWLDEQAGFSPAPEPVVRVGLLATYARWKGHDVFLEAVARVRREPLPVPVRFYVIGGPIYQTAGSQYSVSELRALAARWHVAEHVGLVPFQPDPVHCYRALDVAVHASTRPEPFGLTIVEAMGCGRAVVAVQAGGAAELFTPGHDALGVPPADAGALAAAVRALICDPEQRLRLGRNARQTTVSRFSTALLPPQLSDAYGSLGSRTSASCRVEGLGTVGATR
jgi:glycosyltransferase involved in cell wall biosynthesis